jgi:hypothetical protein
MASQARNSRSDERTRDRKVVLLPAVIAVATTAVIVGVVVGSRATSHRHDTSRARSAAAATAQPVAIDPDGNEVFAAERNGNPALTASQAYGRYANGAAVPASVQPEYGKLNWSSPAQAGQPKATIVDNESVWAYTANVSCAPDGSIPIGPSDTPAPVSTSGAPNNCTDWLFLDANTGAQVDESILNPNVPHATPTATGTASSQPAR